MKFSVATIVLALSGSALAGIHTDYRADGTIDKVYIVKEEVARAIPQSISSVTPSSTKRPRCGRPPASSSVSSIVSSTSVAVVVPSSVPSSSSAVPSSSEASSSSAVSSSSELSSSSPTPSPSPSSSSSSSSIIPPPLVCVPSRDHCSLYDPGKCCSLCCMRVIGATANDGECC